MCDVQDGSHYTGDYMTKWSERVGPVMPFLWQGLESLPQLGTKMGPKEDDGKPEEEKRVVDSYAERRFDKCRKPKGPSILELRQRARKLYTRLETSANRATMKKLPEMMFQLLHGHECYKSHETWTLFCGFPFFLAHRAQEVNRARLANNAAQVPDDPEESLQVSYQEQTGEDQELGSTTRLQDLASLHAEAYHPFIECIENACIALGWDILMLPALSVLFPPSIHRALVYYYMFVCFSILLFHEDC